MYDDAPRVRRKGDEWSVESRGACAPLNRGRDKDHSSKELEDRIRMGTEVQRRNGAGVRNKRRKGVRRSRKGSGGSGEDGERIIAAGTTDSGGRRFLV